MVVVAQVSVPLEGVILAIGAVVFEVITLLAVAVQPLLPVTVTLYVPAAAASVPLVVTFPPVAFHK